MRKVIFIFLFFNIIFTACKDNNDTTPDVTGLLTGSVWQGDEGKAEIVGSTTALTFFGFADLPTDSTIDLTGATIKFDANGTFEASSVGDLIIDDVNGTWELLEGSENGQRVRLQGLDITIPSPPDLPGLFELEFTDVWTIKKLDETSLVLSNTTQTTITKEALEAVLPPNLTSFARDLDIVMELDVTYFR